MRTRYKKYTDYGLDKREVLQLFEYLNNLQDAKEKENIKKIIYNGIPAGASEYVFLALMEHRGYDYLCKKGLTYGKSDFYGYKRKGLWLIHDNLVI